MAPFIPHVNGRTVDSTAKHPGPFTPQKRATENINIYVYYLTHRGSEECTEL